MKKGTNWLALISILFAANLICVCGIFVCLFNGYYTTIGPSKTAEVVIKDVVTENTIQPEQRPTQTIEPSPTTVNPITGNKNRP